MAERSKALVLGTSHYDGVGSYPTAASIVLKFCETLFFVEFLKLGFMAQSVGSNPTAASIVLKFCETLFFVEFFKTWIYGAIRGFESHHFQCLTVYTTNMFVCFMKTV